MSLSFDIVATFRRKLDQRPYETISAFQDWARKGKASDIMSKAARHGRLEARIVDAKILVSYQRALIERMKASGHSTTEEFVLEQMMNSLRRLYRSRQLLQHARLSPDQDSHH